MIRRASVLRRLLAGLSVGMAVTIALAWLAMFLPRGNAWNGPRLEQDLGIAAQEDGVYWMLRRGDNAWHTTVDYWHMQSSGRSLWMPLSDYEARKYDFHLLPRHLRPASLAELNVSATYHATGWPFKALACSVHWEQQIANADVRYTVRGGLQLRRDQDFNPRALPFSPIWAGAMADVLLFAAAWMVLMTSAGALRTIRRRRPGRCPACGYSRAGLPVQAPCPECGTG